MERSQNLAQTRRESGPQGHIIDPGMDQADGRRLAVAMSAAHGHINHNTASSALPIMRRLIGQF